MSVLGCATFTVAGGCRQTIYEAGLYARHLGLEISAPAETPIT
jgi:hypothetical protein